ncbi:MAG TPA: arylesterase [Bryobacteraceae bacterium]|nr:arylesterase [Bryobacteraceae bacterium]
MRRILSLLAALLVLEGCGGQPEPERRAPEPGKSRSPMADDTRPVIAAFGDSLTEGFGVDPAHSYPSILQREMDARGYPYRVVNLGVSGDTTTNGVARLSTVLALKPAIVVLEFGANDGLRGLPVARARANLETMITALAGGGATVVLAGMTLPPNYGAGYIREFERMYRELAAKHRLALIPFLLEGVGGTEVYMQGDGLHPNAEGSAKVAQNVLKVLEPLLRSRRDAA